MGYTNGPQIVTSGLVFYLDAANSKSYPGSGATWTDLTASISGSLVNSPSYSSSNKGFLSFDGTNDYYTVTGVPTRSNTITNDIWVYPTVIFGGEGGRSTLIRMIGSRPNSALSADFYFSLQNPGTVLTEIRNLANTGYVQYATGTIISINRWYNIVQIINGTTGNLQIYVNGVRYINSAIDIYNRETSNTIQLAQQGTDVSNTYARRLTGRIASVKLYGTALTASQVLQNYNATKGRYGL